MKNKDVVEEVADIIKEQIKRGYLKLAVLFVLIREPSHGYQIMKNIKEATLGLITPTVGAIYPTLRELEEKGLIKGAWKQGRRRTRVYEITEKGREVFRRTIEKHLNLASTIRNWILKELSVLGIIDEIRIAPSFLQAIRVLLLDEKATSQEKIESLRRLEKELKQLDKTIKTMIANINDRIKELGEKSYETA